MGRSMKRDETRDLGSGQRMEEFMGHSTKSFESILIGQGF